MYDCTHRLFLKMSVFVTLKHNKHHKVKVMLYILSLESNGYLHFKCSIFGQRMPDWPMVPMSKPVLTVCSLPLTRRRGEAATVGIR